MSTSELQIHTMLVQMLRNQQAMMAVMTTLEGDNLDLCIGETIEVLKYVDKLTDDEIERLRRIAGGW